MNIRKWNFAFFTILFSLLSFSSCSKDDEFKGVDVTISDLTNYKWACSFTETDGESYASKGTVYLYFGNNERGLETVKQTTADVGLADIWDSKCTTEFTYSISGDKVYVTDDTGTSVFVYTGSSLKHVSGGYLYTTGDFTQRTLTSTDKEIVKYGCMTDDERYDFDFCYGGGLSYSYDYQNKRYWGILVDLGSKYTDLYSRNISYLRAVHSISSGTLENKDASSNKKSITQTAYSSKGTETWNTITLYIVTSTSVNSITISSDISFYDAKKKYTYKNPGTHKLTYNFKK